MYLELENYTPFLLIVTTKMLLVITRLFDR